MLVCWLVVLRIYVALAVFQPYRDLEAGDNQSLKLKFKWRGGESNPGPLAPQAKSLTTRPPPLPYIMLSFYTVGSCVNNIQPLYNLFKFSCVSLLIFFFSELICILVFRFVHQQNLKLCFCSFCKKKK